VKRAHAPQKLSINSDFPRRRCEAALINAPYILKYGVSRHQLKLQILPSNETFALIKYLERRRKCPRLSPTQA
jgi:hypothetical protein